MKENEGDVIGTYDKSQYFDFTGIEGDEEGLKKTRERVIELFSGVEGFTHIVTVNDGKWKVTPKLPGRHYMYKPFYPSPREEWERPNEGDVGILQFDDNVKRDGWDLKWGEVGIVWIEVSNEAWLEHFQENGSVFDKDTDLSQLVLLKDLNLET